MKAEWNIFCSNKRSELTKKRNEYASASQPQSDSLLAKPQNLFPQILNPDEQKARKERKELTIASLIPIKVFHFFNQAIRFDCISI